MRTVVPPKGTLANCVPCDGTLRLWHRRRGGTVAFSAGLFGGAHAAFFTSRRVGHGVPTASHVARPLRRARRHWPTTPAVSRAPSAVETPPGREGASKSSTPTRCRSATTVAATRRTRSGSARPSTGRARFDRLEAWFLQEAMTALSQFNHRHYLMPTAKGVDFRLLHGYCYLSPGTIDDPGGGGRGITSVNGPGSTPALGRAVRAVEGSHRRSARGWSG